MNKLTRAAVLAAILGAGAATAQEPAYPPVIKDLAPRYDIKPDGAFDILGFEPGLPRSEALALLKKTFPRERIVNSVTAEGVADGRGNKVSFKYYPSDALTFLTDQTGGITAFTVSYTTGVSGERVSSIERTVEYKKAQPALEPFVESLKAKYGEPSFTEDEANGAQGTTLYYVWYEGKLATISAADFPKRSEAGPPHCLEIYEDTYRVKQDRTDEYPGCTAYMRVIVEAGPQPDLLGSVYMHLIDYRRWYDNGVASDQYLMTELQKAADAAPSADAPAL